MALQVVGDFGLQMLSTLSPVDEKSMERLQLHEQMVRRAQLRSGTREDTAWFNQVRGRVSVATLAAVSGLISPFTFWTGTSHKTIGQKGTDLGIVQLANFALGRLNRLGAKPTRTAHKVLDSPRCACCRNCRRRYGTR